MFHIIAHSFLQQAIFYISCKVSYLEVTGNSTSCWRLKMPSYFPLIISSDVDMPCVSLQLAIGLPFQIGSPMVN